MIEEIAAIAAPPVAGDTLRARAGDIIHEYLMQSIGWEKGWVDDAPESDDYADRILALVCDALLSDRAGGDGPGHDWARPIST